MTFAAPGLLFGLFGALIPLILHLLFRRKPKVQVLPTLRFIRMANQKVLKRHRLRRRLLLIARMLLVGLAAIAMSRPFLVTQSTALINEITDQELDLATLTEISGGGKKAKKKLGKWIEKTFGKSIQSHK